MFFSALRDYEGAFLHAATRLCLINAVDSMGRRNTKPKSPYKGLNS